MFRKFTGFPTPQHAPNSNAEVFILAYVLNSHTNFTLSEMVPRAKLCETK